MGFLLIPRFGEEPRAEVRPSKSFLCVEPNFWGLSLSLNPAFDAVLGPYSHLFSYCVSNQIIPIVYVS